MEDNSDPKTCKRRIIHRKSARLTERTNSSQQVGMCAVSTTPASGKVCK